MPVDGTRVDLRAVEADGTSRQCRDLYWHSWRSLSGTCLPAGCQEEILTVTTGEGGPVFDMLAYQEDLPEGGTTVALLGAKSMQVFLGICGKDGLLVIDPADARSGYALTEDGSLHRIDILAGSLTTSARDTGPYSLEGRWLPGKDGSQLRRLAHGRYRSSDYRQVHRRSAARRQNRACFGVLWLEGMRADFNAENVLLRSPAQN